MRDQQPLGVRGFEGLDRLVGGEMAARAAFRVRRQQCRLADEEVGVLCQSRQGVARPRVARVGEHGSVGGGAEAEGQQLVVQHPLGSHLEAGGFERLAVDVFVQVERAREHVWKPEARANPLEHFGAPRRDPERGSLRVLAGAEHASPDPGNEVAPVVEVPVRDRDRVELGPGLALAETSEHARSAVQQDAPAVALQEVPGLGSARVRPGWGTPSYDEFHASIIAIYLPPVARKIRVVIAKPGLDGHDRGAKIIARALRDAGMEVIYTGLHQTPEQIVETAIQEDADAVGISILSGAHMTLVPRILDGLRDNGAEDVLVVVGGTIPAEDAEELKRQGVAAVFTPGAPTSEIVDFLRGEVTA